MIRPGSAWGCTARDSALSPWLVAVMLLPFCPFCLTGGFSGRSMVFTLFEVLKIVVLIAFLVMVRKRDFKLPTAILVVSIIYELTYLVPAIVYDDLTSRSLYLWFKDFYSIVLIILLLASFMQRDYHVALQGVYRLLAVLAIAHVVIFYATGVELLGIRTRFADSTIIALTLLGVLCFMEHRGPRTFDLVFLAVSAYYVIEQWISTAVTLFALMLLAVVMCRFEIFSRLAHYAGWLTGALALNFSLVVLRIQNLFSWLIVDILGEDLAMDGRTLIWDFAFQDMQRHVPWLGAGIQPDGSKDIHVATFNEWGHQLMGDRQAHNQLVSVFYFNGVPGLICYIALLFIAGMNLVKVRDWRIAFFFAFGMFVLVLGMCTELIADNYYLFMFVVAMFYAYKANEYQVGEQASKGIYG